MNHKFKVGDRVRILSFAEIIPDDTIPPLSVEDYMERERYCDINKEVIDRYSKLENLQISSVLDTYAEYDTPTYRLSCEDNSDTAEILGMAFDDEIFYMWHESMLDFDYSYLDEEDTADLLPASDDIMMSFLEVSAYV